MRPMRKLEPRSCLLPAALALSVAAGPGCSRPGSCDALPARPPLAACVVPEGGWEDPPLTDGQQLTVELAGAVIDAGDGSPPDECFSGPTVAGIAPSTADASHAWWFKAADAAGQVWTVGVSFPGVTRPYQVSDPIDARFSFTPYAFSTSIGNLALRRADESEIDAWIGHGGTLADLAIPTGITVTEGDAVCHASSDCGSWEGYDLVGAAGGEPVPLEYAGTADAGGYRFLHAGDQHAVGEPGGCPDWYVADVTLGIAPVP